MVTGDAGTWTWHHEGRQISTDNPLLLANRKAKRLSRLLRRQKACSKIRLPFLEPLVFCSAPNVNCQLDARGAPGRPRPRRRADRRSSRAARASSRRSSALQRRRRDAPASPRDRSPVARALSPRHGTGGHPALPAARRVGDYVLARLLFEGPGYQDWEATTRRAPARDPPDPASTRRHQGAAPSRARRWRGPRSASSRSSRASSTPASSARSTTRARARARPGLRARPDGRAARPLPGRARRSASTSTSGSASCARSPRRSGTPTRRSWSTGR